MLTIALAIALRIAKLEEDAEAADFVFIAILDVVVCLIVAVTIMYK